MSQQVDPEPRLQKWNFLILLDSAYVCMLFAYFNKDCILQIMQASEEDKNNFVGMNGEVTFPLA